LGGVEHDLGSIEQVEVAVEPQNRCLDYSRRTSVSPVRLVRAQSDCVEVRCFRHAASPR
jgi:hypothetical protein